MDPIWRTIDDRAQLATVGPMGAVLAMPARNAPRQAFVAEATSF
jgi:hypothetical protein